MIKETVTCEDLFTGEEKTVDLYFHLTEAELTLLDFANKNKFSTFKDKGAENVNEADIELFGKLISKAYGKKTDNGQFIKNDEIRDAFLCSPEFSALMDKFITGEIDITKFVLGCFPKKVSSKMQIGPDGKPVVIGK